MDANKKTNANKQRNQQTNKTQHKKVTKLVGALFAKQWTMDTQVDGGQLTVCVSNNNGKVRPSRLTGLLLKYNLHQFLLETLSFYPSDSLTTDASVLLLQVLRTSCRRHVFSWFPFS